MSTALEAVWLTVEAENEEAESAPVPAARAGQSHRVEVMEQSRPITDAMREFRRQGYDNQQIACLLLNAAALCGRDEMRGSEFEALARHYWRVMLRQTSELAIEAAGVTPKSRRLS